MRALAVGLLTLLVSLPAFATETRVASLGGAEQEFLVLDEFNVLHLPATLALFPNVTYAEFASVWPGAQADGGAPYSGLFAFHYAITDKTVVAFYGSSSHRSVLMEPVEYIADWTGSDIEDDEMYGDAAVNRAEHKGTLLVAHRLGDLRLGLELGFWGSSSTIDKPENLQTALGGTHLDVALGLGLDLADNQTFDLAGRLSLGWFDDDRFVIQGGESYLATRLDVSTEWSGQLLARGVLKLGTEKLVPFASIGFGGGGVAWNQAVTDAPDTSLSVMAVSAGANLVLQPLEGVYVMPGAGLRWASRNLEDGGNTQLGLSVFNPFFGVAVDARLATWLALRFAARQNLTWASTETATLEGSESDSQTEMTMGLGIRMGQVDIEWMLNPQMLVQGPAVLSGGDTAVSFATQAALKFTW